MEDSTLESPLNEEVERIGSPPRSYDRLRLQVAAVTFLAYASFHMSRKPNSIVKSALHPVSSDGTSKYDPHTDPGWEPFNQDLIPSNVADAGLKVSGAGDASGLFECPEEYHRENGICERFTHANKAGNFEIGLVKDSALCSTNVSGIEHHQDNLNLCWVISKEEVEKRKDLFVQFYDGDLPASTSKDTSHGVFWYKIEGGNDEPKFEKDTSVKSVANIKNGQIYLGDLDTAFLLCYTIGLVFSGYVADRVNIKKFLFVGMFGSGSCLILLSLTYWLKIHSLSFFVIINMLAGFFQSVGWPSMVAIMGSWFGHGNRGLIMGVWNSHTSIGNILGSVITAAAISDGLHSEDWPLGFAAPGVLMCAMAIFVYIFLIPYPRDAGIVLPESIDGDDEYEPLDTGEGDDSDNAEDLNGSTEETGFVETLKVVLLIPGLIPFSLCLAFAKMCAYSLLYWGPNFLSYVGFSSSDAGYLCSFFDIGGIFGGITSGFLADRTGRPASVAFGFLLCAVPAISFYYNQSVASGPVSGPNIWLMILIGFFINAPYALITTAVSADLGTHESVRGKQQILATVTGIIDASGSLGAVLQGVVIGTISTSSWKNVFGFLMTAAGIAAMILLPLVYKDCKRR